MYLWNDPEATIVRAARVRNADMPNYAVRLLEDVHGSLKDQRVTVLGAAYPGGVKETAFSGVFSTVAALESAGALVQVHDPLYSNDELRSLGFTPFAEGTEGDAAIVQAGHVEYLSCVDSRTPGGKDSARWEANTGPQSLALRYVHCNRRCTYA